MDTPKAPVPGHRTRSRSPTGSTCGRTWPSRSRKPSPRNHRCLHADSFPPAPTSPDTTDGPTDPVVDPAAPTGPRESSTLVVRTKARYQAVQELKAQGKGIKAIVRELGLVKQTVRRFYYAASVDELLATPRAGRRSILDKYGPYLHERFTAGNTNMRGLHREITALGYRGGYSALRDYLAPLRATSQPPTPRPVVPKVRQLTSWLLRHPADLSEDEQLQVKQALTACPHLTATAGHVTTFADMLTTRTGHHERLTAWMDTVKTDDLPHLHRFIRGLHRDLPAVVNGLTLPHNSGTVEGTVNRIKMIKRQMYGRAKFDLLRARILHTP